MKLDLLFTSHNRKEFTEASFAALLEHTNWDLVNHLHIVDDASSDGTTAYLLSHDAYCAPGSLMIKQFGGPVSVMNYVLDQSDAEVLAKIDNDVIVCPGWLEAMLDVLKRNDQIDVLGMEAGFGKPLGTNVAQRDAQPARWIGGVGLIRTRIFEHRRPEPNNRWFGWTAFQRQCNCAWISPDLPMFLLDKMPIDPWRSLSEEYIRKGWQRRWPPYSPAFEPYWSWWTQRLAPLS